VPDTVQRRHDQDDVSGRKPLDEYDEDYGDYNGYDEGLEEQQRNAGRQVVSPDHDEQDEQVEQDEEKSTDHANYHKDYFPREEMYEMVGGFLANHHPPTETNFYNDHSELDNQREKPDRYLYDSSEDDDVFTKQKDDEYYGPESRQAPTSNLEAGRTNALVPNAFEELWSRNPEKEISKQVISFFRDVDHNRNPFRISNF
jgi:hypothetical protein